MIFFSPIIYFISILIGGLHYKYFNQNLVKVFLFFIIFSDMTEIASSVLAYLGIKNHSLANVYLLGLFLFITNIILIQRFKPISSFFISFVLLSLILYLVEFNLLNTNTPLLIIVSSLAIVISGYFIIKESNDDITYITKNPLFWLSSGLLIYYFSMLGMLVLFKIITSPNHKLITSYFDYFNYLMIILSNLLFIKGFLCNKTMKS